MIHSFNTFIETFKCRHGACSGWGGRVKRNIQICPGGTSNPVRWWCQPGRTVLVGFPQLRSWQLDSEAGPLLQGCVWLGDFWGARTRRNGRWQVLTSLVPTGVLRCSLSTWCLVFSLGFGADRPGPSSQGDYLAWGCGCHSLLTWMWQESLWGGPSACCKTFLLMKKSFGLQVRWLVPTLAPTSRHLVGGIHFHFIEVGAQQRCASRAAVIFRGGFIPSIISGTNIWVPTTCEAFWTRKQKVQRSKKRTPKSFQRYLLLNWL